MVYFRLKDTMRQFFIRVLSLRFRTLFSKPCNVPPSQSPGNVTFDKAKRDRGQDDPSLQLIRPHTKEAEIRHARGVSEFPTDSYIFYLLVLPHLSGNAGDISKTVSFLNVSHKCRAELTLIQTDFTPFSDSLESLLLREVELGPCSKPLNPICNGMATRRSMFPTSVR